MTHPTSAFITASVAALLGLTRTGAAQAAPPSSSLVGPEGKLSWTVTAQGNKLLIHGVSPKWTVDHTARADLSPVRTERRDANGAHYVVTYDPDGATVVGPDGSTHLDAQGLWDADTVDVALGQLVATGQTELKFKAIDLSGPKVYSFRAEKLEDTTCASQPCSHVELTLGGVLRYLGPTWQYWYGSDGELLRFDGPAGTFQADGTKP